MEIEPSNLTETYIGLLKDTLEQKLLLISELLSLTEQQSIILKSENLEEEQFNQLMVQKDALLVKLDQLDVGFDRTYRLISEEVSSHKEWYRNEVIVLQDLIRKITDISVNIQVTEKRNKDALITVLSSKRREIKKFKVQNNAVTNYYKNMANQYDTQSIFYDKKK